MTRLKARFRGVTGLSEFLCIGLVTPLVNYLSDPCFELIPTYELIRDCITPWVKVLVITANIVRLDLSDGA